MFAKGRVEVFVGHAPGQRFTCPECGQELAVYDHLGERTWRHLDSMQFLTYLHARPPRVSCAQHGVKQVRLPWAQAGGRFTHLFEALGVTVLRATNVKRAGEILRITWDEAWHIMERAVLRGRTAKGHSMPTLLGVDEKAIAKGHSYMTLVCDLQAATVERAHADDAWTRERLRGPNERPMPPERPSSPSRRAEDQDRWLLGADPRHAPIPVVAPPRRASLRARRRSRARLARWRQGHGRGRREPAIPTVARFPAAGCRASGRARAG